MQAPGKYSQPGSFWRCVAAWQDAAIARDGSAPSWRMAGVGRNTAAQEAAGWPAVAVAAAGDARCAGSEDDSGGVGDSAQAGSSMGGAIVAVRGGGANGNGLEAPRQHDGAGVDAQAGSSALGRCQLAAW